ncbi:MAG: hypothetical protein KDA84_21090, partial [Planctomycetaceae bacterium]|nr:hypothetical protein [Planctomycetaceae bacterium]
RRSDESLRYLMLTETHANSASSRTAAFEDYLNVAKSLGGDLELNQLAEGHLVRTDRWVKGRFEELKAAASPDELQHWNRLVSQKLLTELKKQPPESRLEILSCLPRLPAVESAELASLQELGTTKNPLEQSFRLKRIAQSQDPATCNKANIALAELYLAWGRESDAAPIIQKLGKNWPGPPLENSDELQSSAIAWPERKLEARFLKRRDPVLPELPVEIVKNQDSAYAHWTFSIDQQSSKLQSRDENGNKRWNWDLGELPANIRDYSQAEIAFQGHLAVVAFKTHFVVLDLLKRENTATLRWWKALVDEELDDDQLFQMQRFGGNPFNVRVLPPRRDIFGNVLLVNEEAIIYQFGQRLIAADPLTGKPQWMREDLRPRCQLHGNGRHVVVNPPNTNSGFIQRTTDGETVRVFNLPRLESQVAFDGTNLIHLRGEALSRVLVCRNLVDDEVLWELPCLDGTQVEKVGRDELALLSTDGTLRIVRLTDGKVKIQTKVDPDGQRKSFKVYRL